MKPPLAIALGLALIWPSLASAKEVRVSGYVKRDGTYVAPHYRTAPNNSTHDNFSTRGNYNPYTGQAGEKDPCALLVSERNQGLGQAPVDSGPKLGVPGYGSSLPSGNHRKSALEPPPEPESPSAARASERSPEELGAVVSAIAFVEVCQSLTVAPKYLDAAKPEEAALIGLAAQFRTGMIQSVAMTMTATADFRVGSIRVCVDQSLAPREVVDEMAAMISKDKSQFVGRPVPDIQTPAAILLAIHRLSPCK